MVVRFYCYGHKNILATHRTTLEFTTDPNLSLGGDCIVGVRSSMSLKGLPFEFKNLIRQKDSTIVVNIKAAGFEETIKGKGHPKLELNHETDIVIRKSDYTCPRTLMINADKAAKDLSRDLVKVMKNEETRMEITITVL